MTIFYAQDKEHWEDSEDPEFEVDMTPECGVDNLPEFDTQDEFRRWYYAH